MRFVVIVFFSVILSVYAYRRFLGNMTRKKEASINDRFRSILHREQQNPCNRYIPYVLSVYYDKDTHCIAISLNDRYTTLSRHEREYVLSQTLNLCIPEVDEKDRHRVRMVAFLGLVLVACTTRKPDGQRKIHL